MGNKFLQYFSLTLTVIGAINWGLIGFFNLNLVALLFGSMSLLSRIIYGLVGLCGLYLLSFYGLVSMLPGLSSSYFQKTPVSPMKIIPHVSQKSLK